MGKTVFSKLMIVFIVIIVISTVMSAALISQSYSAAYIRNQKDHMEYIARDISTMAAYNYADIISMQYLLNLVVQLAANNQVVIWIADSQDAVLLSVDPTRQTQVTTGDLRNITPTC